jgi:hypothetical protein
MVEGTSHDGIDFEAEGLLDGVAEGDRSARLSLLHQLGEARWAFARQDRGIELRGGGPPRAWPPARDRVTDGELPGAKAGPAGRRAVEETAELLRSLGHEVAERDPTCGQLFADHDVLLTPVTAAQPEASERRRGKGAFRTFNGSGPTSLDGDLQLPRSVRRVRACGLRRGGPADRGADRFADRRGDHARVAGRAARARPAVGGIADRRSLRPSSARRAVRSVAVDNAARCAWS